jgi:hypothetical protein
VAAVNVGVASGMRRLRLSAQRGGGIPAMKYDGLSERAFRTFMLAHPRRCGGCSSTSSRWCVNARSERAPARDRGANSRSLITDLPDRADLAQHRGGRRSRWRAPGGHPGYGRDSGVGWRGS